MSGAPPVVVALGPLPRGTTVLEASAGTGKTHTIAALATRYVAEGAAEVEELLLVTFGRAATSELRDRVRSVMVATHAGLTGSPPAREVRALVEHLAGDGPHESARRAARLTRALAELDAATITTTHGFCHRMLAALGVLGDVDGDALFAPDAGELLRDVVDDLYLARYAAAEEPALDLARARTVAAAAIADHHARLAPDDAPAGSPSAHRVAFARDARAELARRKRAGRLLDYDDLLVLLRDALTDPTHGDAAGGRLRARYRVVMVDEFQDTDPVQWDVLRAAFHGHRTLVLIGDPKQAIYAFRGADVVTYLGAREVAGGVQTLDRNWRSDRPLVRGLDHLLGGAALGDPRIVVRPVDAAHAQSRLTGAPPVRLRCVTRHALGVARGKAATVGSARAFVADDVAADVVRLLTGEERLVGDGTPRPVRPGDVAVLTRRNEDAAAVRDALVHRGVPAVQSGLASVFAAPAARHWLTLLLALEQPGNAGRAGAAALTPFLGRDAAGLGTATDAERDGLAELLSTWSRLLAAGGVAAVLDAVEADGLARRLLLRPHGERALVDLRHVAQALHVASREGGLGPSALVEWLRAQMSDAEKDRTEERSRRLETDAEAVQVVTVHASKGLEFPIVYVPFAWDRYVEADPDPLRAHDAAGARVLHVGGPGTPGYAELRGGALAEDLGEDLRLLYVALTRAASQLVVWWAPATTAAHGPLTRVLLGDRAAGQVPPARVPPPADEDALARLATLAARSGGTVSLEVVREAAATARWAPPAAPAPRLEVAAWGRRVDTAWRRTSYSALTAHAHAAPPGGVVTEPETRAVDDEAETLPPIGAASPAAGGAGPTALAAGLALPSPLAALPGGAAAGTMVHRILERVDTASGDLPRELLDRCREVMGAGSRADGGPARFGPVDLAAALDLVLATPLGPLAHDLALRDIPPRDRLAELEFEFPLGGGDAPPGRAAASLDAVARLLRRHLPPTDLFAGYAHRLEALGDAALRGYLTGSIDAVLRLRVDGGPRYVVVDYKTNRLAPPSEPLVLGHYGPAATAQAMRDAHYPLQLLLYLVALHRFLRWRQPGYDPETHLAGGLYLFVRGMAGPGTPRVDGTPCGVVGWRPPPPLVVELSDLLHGASERPARLEAAAGAGGRPR